jgi:hypothetical protein
LQLNNLNLNMKEKLNPAIAAERNYVPKPT